MIELETFTFNPFQVNTYIIFNRNAEGFIIDAACSEKNEIQQLLDFVEKNKIRIKALINTHCHIDHILGVEFLRNYFNVEFFCSRDDQFLLDNSLAQGQLFNLIVTEPSKPEKYLSEGDRLSLGETEIQILQVPGHSPGSLAYFLENEKKLFSGDVLFSGSIGRTDLPGGDYETLVNGIKSKFMVLEDDVEVYPGHGPSTTIGNEKILNPFLQ